MKMKRVAVLLLFQTILLFASFAAGADSRLAIGIFGLSPENRDAKLADVITAQLSASPGLDLVERRELNAVLKEASLGLSGVVRAKDAVRVGKLLRADQFLLGSSISINQTNRLVIRLVDARTGVIRAINAFWDTGSLEILAKEITAFVQEESKHPLQAPRDFLAIGVVQNLGVNNRFANFPAQLRGSVAASLSKKMTVLERDVISFLANEVRMDLAGLAEHQEGQSAQMQFGFWIVDGFYQSYEVSGAEVQLQLRVERVLGGQQTFMLQGKPEEQFFTKICDSIEQAVRQPAGIVPPSRQGEIAALEARGRQLADYAPTMNVLTRTLRLRTAINPDKVMNTLDETTRVYESILLLDPDNVSAKMRLAACLLFEAEKYGGLKRGNLAERSARANDFYREVIATGDAEFAVEAQICLAESCGGLGAVEMLRRFSNEATDPKGKTRLRYYANDMLTDLAYDLPIENILPHSKAQLFDELKDLRQSTNEPFIVSFENALFAWRLHPDQRERVINALLPELLENVPDLKPYILLAAVGEQTTTNSPVVAQFLASLKQCEEHPESLLRPSSYFAHLSTTVEDEKAARSGWVYAAVYERAFGHQQYATVVAMALARQRAAEKGLAPPLTDKGRGLLAQSHAARGEWQQALDIYNTLADVSPQAKNECLRHLGMAKESEALPDSTWRDKGDMAKVELTYQCIERKQWGTAVAILESIGRRTVRMNRGGPWGHAFTPVLPAVVADECRAKAGLPPFKDPMRFEISEPPYVGFERDGPRMFSFELEGEDLWLATYSQIKLFRGDGPFVAAKPLELHEFERTTRGRNTSICVGSEYIWAGTYDDGLVELDRRTGVCRRLTMNDGLPLNAISGLKLQGQTLWIAYRNGENGAVGTLDLKTHKISTLTPNLSPKAGANSQPHYYQAMLSDPHEPPTLPVSSMALGETGEMWFAVAEQGLRRFRGSDGIWDAIGPVSAYNAYYPAMAVEATAGLLLLAKKEHGVLDGEKSKSGGLVIYDYRQNKAGVLQIYQGLPSNDLTAVATDGKIAWVGGRGFVAVLDIQERKVLRVAYISASQIGGIQLGRTHVWIAVSCGDNSDSQFSGNAWTGVYRLHRAAIEPAEFAAKLP